MFRGRRTNANPLVSAQRCRGLDRDNSIRAHLLLSLRDGQIFQQYRQRFLYECQWLGLLLSASALNKFSHRLFFFFFFFLPSFSFFHGARVSVVSFGYSLAAAAAATDSINRRRHFAAPTSKRLDETTRLSFSAARLIPAFFEAR